MHTPIKVILRHPFKPTAASRLLRLFGLLALGALPAHPSAAGSFTADFDSGQPPGAWCYGNAYADYAGGVSDSGVLKLTDLNNWWEQGALVMDDLDMGAPVAAFTANFKMLIGGGTAPADGLSFNFAEDLPDAPVPSAEEGVGSGLSVNFDTYDNTYGGLRPEAPAIEIKLHGNLVASFPATLDLFRTGSFVPVTVSLSESSNFKLTVNGKVLYDGFVPWMPRPGRFGFYARTGGEVDNHWIDDVQITTTVATPACPTVRMLKPFGLNQRADAPITLGILNGTVTQLRSDSVRLTLNGTAVTPVIGDSDGLVTATYQPYRLLPPGLNSIVITYSDTAGQEFSVSATFQTSQYRGPTGNIYESVLVPAHITWPQARLAAEQRTYAGHPGHLATITSHEEDLYLENLREDQQPLGGYGQLWVGGYQLAGAAEPGGGWVWINNEGPISGLNGGATYSNWTPNQPSNDWLVNDGNPWFPGENYLAMGFNWKFQWNDDGARGDGRWDATLDGYMVEYEPEPALIDIKPGQLPNRINLANNGQLPVAIISTASLNATNIDPSTITFGTKGTEAHPLRWTLTDVNGDGISDLLCHFNTQDLGLRCASTLATLRAETFQGWPVRGTDSVEPLNCPEYALRIQALQDVNKVTDVYLSVASLASQVPAPSSAQHIQLKTVDLLGQTRWSANFQEVPMTSQSPNVSVAALQFSNLLHLQKFDVRMDVQTAQSGGSAVLLETGGVLLRPDLVLKEVSAPKTAFSHFIVNISAVVTEQNGELGANARAFLMEGSQILDRIDSISIAPHGRLALMFSTKFATSGTHQLRVVVDSVAPGDYDLSNNEKSITIDVAEYTPQAVSCGASYMASAYENYQEYSSPYYDWYTGVSGWNTGTNSALRSDEDFRLYLYLPGPLSFPLPYITFDTVSDGVATGGFQATNATPDQVYSPYDDGSTLSLLWRWYPGGFQLYVESFQPLYGQGYSRAEVTAWNVDQTYYSVWHDTYWGDSKVVSFGNGGVPLRARATLDARIVIQTETDLYGGTAQIPITGEGSEDHWNIQNEDGSFDRGWYKSYFWSGYFSGDLTP